MRTEKPHRQTYWTLCVIGYVYQVTGYLNTTFEKYIQIQDNMPTVVLAVGLQLYYQGWPTS